MLRSRQIFSIKSVDDRLDSFIRASSILGSLHIAVEELILNSIDAGATDIKVEIQLPNFFPTSDDIPQIVIHDDGHGIDIEQLRDFVAEWNCTSKAFRLIGNADAHGCKGEALSSIRALSSKMEICTRQPNSPFSYLKVMRAKSMSGQEEVKIEKTVDNQNTAKYGTSIAVYNLFHNLSVRAKAMRADVEMAYVKDFMRRMSVLHHSINWLLVDKSKDRIIFHAPSHSSVAKRFISLHGLEVFLRMTEVTSTVGSFTVSGLISYPNPASCHWTKDFQYMYLNNRWLKSNGSISNIFDRIYRRVLIAKRTGGPTAMHHSPNKVQNAHHPCFVLQILCDNSEFDILSEPDKSHAVFRDVAGLHRCIFQLLRNLFLEHLSDYYDLFLAEYTRLTGEIGAVEASTAIVEPLKGQSAYGNDDVIPTLAPLYTISEPIVPLNPLEKPSSRDSAGSTPSSNAFYNAFCSHSPSPTSARKATKVFSDSNTQLQRSQNHMIEAQRKLYSRDDNQSSESEATGDVIIGAMVKRKASPVVDDLSAQSEYQPENNNHISANKYNDDGTDDRDDDNDDENDDQGTINSKKRKCNYDISPARRLFDLVAEADDISEETSSNRSALAAFQSTYVNGEEAEGIPSLGEEHERSPNPNIISTTWNLDDDFAVATGAPTPSVSRMSRLDSGTRAVKLHKDMLSSHSVVGQWDSKFIIATFASTSPSRESKREKERSKRQDTNRRLILLFDQHALDERLNFEKYQSQFLASTSRGVTVDSNSPQWSTTVSTGTMQLIRRADDILRQWHFRYSISCSPQDDSGSSSGGGEDCDHDGSKRGSYVVSLTETLQILEEPLTINDFLEFVYYLNDQMHVLPMCALKPPAVTRILAFRSCHSSVRFGDQLSLGQCKDMVNQLPLTSFPFQCAHGRPSMVPLVEYVNDKRGHSIRPPSYKNIFDELAALDIRI